jgi:phosphoribosylanthranilate isomerase
MTKIKICGITNIEDALLAIDLGADALGFVFYRGSKRYIDPENANNIISKLPPFITTVGIFVNQGLDEINYTKERAGFDTIQLHGDESPDFCKNFARVIKAIRVKENIDSELIESYPVKAVLFDTFSEESYGGTGRSFVWDALKDLNTTKRIILSGGLTPENVFQAVRMVHPYAVDVSTGVEDYPGKKNSEKLKKFIEAVRNED